MPRLSPDAFSKTWMAGTCPGHDDLRFNAGGKSFSLRRGHRNIRFLHHRHVLAYVGNGQDDPAAGDRDLDRPQPRLGIAGMAAGADVELEAVPGADDMHLRLGEHLALAGAVVGDDFLDLGDHLALASRAAHVRAMVEIGVELAVELEHADLELLEAN